MFVADGSIFQKDIAIKIVLFLHNGDCDNRHLQEVTSVIDYYLKIVSLQFVCARVLLY
jgi:hypothetical protein